jgi:general secretion pathway protein I
VSSSSARGFTLLEVLVAVALLGLVVSVLAGSAIQGMGYEGDAARRTRASLIADQALWQIEGMLALGAPPQPRHEESVEAEEYRLLVDVRPLDLTEAGLAALLAPPAEKSGSEAPEPAPAAAPGSAAALTPLYLVQIRVAWTEGLRELEVTRSTFAFDGSAAAQALGASQQEGAVPAPQEEAPQEEVPQ